jgi:uncharacterized protein YegP (UPF0339 family)
MAARGPKFEVYPRHDGQWEWRLYSTNRRVIATSHAQGFRDRRDAIRAVLSVIAAAAKAEVVR